jgi:hypothetical protein
LKGLSVTMNNGSGTPDQGGWVPFYISTRGGCDRQIYRARLQAGSAPALGPVRHLAVAGYGRPGQGLCRRLRYERCQYPLWSDLGGPPVGPGAGQHAAAF